MMVRVLATIILAGGASGGVLLAAPTLAVFAGAAILLLAGAAGVALVIRERERGRTARWQIAAQAALERDLLLARLAVLQMERGVPGRDIETRYYVER